jgi:hypothetical protein
MSHAAFLVLSRARHCCRSEATWRHGPGGDRSKKNRPHACPRSNITSLALKYGSSRFLGTCSRTRWKFIPDAGKITVETSVHAEGGTLAIRIGMTTDFFPRRATTPTVAARTLWRHGFGLAISRMLPWSCTARLRSDLPERKSGRVHLPPSRLAGEATIDSDGRNPLKQRTRSHLLLQRHWIIAKPQV